IFVICRSRYDHSLNLCESVSRSVQWYSFSTRETLKINWHTFCDRSIRLFHRSDHKKIRNIISMHDYLLRSKGMVRWPKELIYTCINICIHMYIYVYIHIYIYIYGEQLIAEAMRCMMDG
ncbi:hypothetical protein Tcan_01763, partial [Toxocara canis]